MQQHIFAALLLLSLAGCAKPPALPPDILKQGAVPAGFTTKADTSSVGAGWLKTFNDPHLEALVNEALNFNHDLAAAKARVDEAAAEARLAGAALMPQVGAATNGSIDGKKTSFNGDGKSTAPSDSRSRQIGGQLSFSWEVDLWGRLSSTKRASQEAFASQTDDFAYARQSLAAQTAKAYFLLIQAARQEKIAAQFVDINKKLSELVELRRANGLSSAYDVALQRSALATAEDQLKQASSGVKRAARSLEVLLGRYPAAELDTGVDLPDMPPAPPAGLPSQLLERRLDIRAAARRVAAAFYQKEAAKAARLPQLSLTSDLGHASQGLRDLTVEQAFWNLGANFVGPVFDGGRIKAQIEQQSARQKEALAMYGKAALGAFQQVETALEDDRQLAERQVLVDTGEKDQAEAMRLASLRFQAGDLDQLSLLTVQEKELNAKLAALLVQVEHLTNRVDLHLALGGGFDQ